MEQTERQWWARKIEQARIDKGWSAAELSRQSGVSETTLTKIKRAEEDVAPGTLARLRDALGIPPRSTYTVAAETQYDREVDYAREVLGQWLQMMPTLEERVEASRYLIRCIMAHQRDRDVPPTGE